MPMVIFLVLFVALVVFAKVRPRSNARRLAEARGWIYTQRDDTVLDRFSTWPFYLGHARRAENVIPGQFEARNVTLFDFIFTNSQGGVGVGVGPVDFRVGGVPRESVTGIFTGFDTGLQIVTGSVRNPMMGRGNKARMNWGICAMEMPGPLPQFLVHVSLSGDRIVETMTEGMGAARVPDNIVTDISLGDPEFDKGFAVRAEDPKLAGVFLPKATRDLLVASRKRMVRHSLHIWTWDRYLFTLENMPLTKKMVTFRLPLMASIIANVGK